jgi:hypothetical protein
MALSWVGYGWTQDDEPTSTRTVERALLGIAKQHRDLAQMEPRIGEVPRRMVPAFPLDQILAAHTFGRQVPLQRSRMHREFGADGVHAALAGRQQPPCQFCHAIG